MELYHARLRDRFAMHVFSLAILGDPSPTWRPDSTSQLLYGCGTTFRFPIAKLLDLRDRLETLIDAAKPVSLALACHVIALATRRQPEERYLAKRRLLWSLHKNHFAGRELSELQKVLDWMLPLPTAWRRRLIMEIEEFILEHEREDKNSLNYIIPELILRRCKKRAEDEGRAQGRAQGRAEGRTAGRAEGEAFGAALGQRRTLMLQLEARYGKLSDRATRALKRADPTQLDHLAIALLEADSLKKALNAVGLRI